MWDDRERDQNTHWDIPNVGFYVLKDEKATAGKWQNYYTLTVRANNAGVQLQY